MTDSVGYVYAIKCGRYVKIGSSYSPESRLRDLRTGNPYPMEIVHSASLQNEGVALMAELEAHKILKDARHHREWFRVSVSAARKAIMQAIENIESNSRAPRPRMSMRAMRRIAGDDPFRLGQLMRAV